MKRYAQVLTVLALIGLLAGFASASTITWGTAQNIAGDTDVATTGMLVHAYATNATTINTVPFTADWVGLNWNGLGYNGQQQGADTFMATNYYLNKNTGAFGSPSAPYVNLSTEYKNMLKGAVYADHGNDTCTYTLGGLTAGNDYLVQIWVNDARGSTRTQLLDGTTSMAYCVGGAAGGAGQYVNGTFTADSATQTFTIWADANGVETVTGIQLRDVTVPEPGTLALLAAGLVGLLAYAWRKRQ